MTLKTRLDSRSKDNATVRFVDDKGKVLAEVKPADSSSVTLEITTDTGIHLEKDNGWKSNQRTE